MIEAITLERVSSGFSRQCVVIKVKVAGEWHEILRDLEVSSNSFVVTAEEIEKIAGVKLCASTTITTLTDQLPPSTEQRSTDQSEERPTENAGQEKRRRK